ncbi:MAG: Holliday junction branch migration protein RuvA [Aphanocapsa lilacina HA4352-LM1]|uniref:Holliday junction branch migration complex subunit RuvA n=1 Tax=Gloeobacter morelensis MG652769 TaxID=2781736 RepID=A0ABY3PHT5_9CYAN|nr:Holliday junction branch migration protein RuvA [Gloeobacter morelensis]MBW4697779.1 Holliday junction branch migration protein RuvA [Aphanocapsa lilacina HA4352-LM1]UFP93194.1 Holliday junction branch migration protein RuvA [Gloeobacter morelensis MG652769]
MITFVRGMLAEVGPRSGQSWATVDVGGVGYRVWTHARTVGKLPRIGEEVKLFTLMIVREDAMQLFGFLESGERELFGQLVSVSGIGPRMGLALLETLAPTELVQAILQGNTRALALAPGVGTKTAQRLALELRSRLSKWREESGMSAVGARASSRVYEEVELALLALGFAPGEVVRALDAVAPAMAGEEQTEAWLRAAIAWLSEQG